MRVRTDAKRIWQAAISAVQPDSAVRRALETADFTENIHLVAIGKAAWSMANAAFEALGNAILDGVVITKYDHSRGPIGNLQIFEAGHPVPDENSYRATRAAMELVKPLGKDDTVLFLVSGGGSALFECPLIDEKEMADITKQLLACGADIVEMNTIRKRLSAVKGGKFAELASPAKVFSIVLSDIIGDPLDMIASGPAYPDSSTCADAVRITEKYDLRLSDAARSLLAQETPKTLSNVETQITGSVRELCAAAEKEASTLGYTCTLLTDCLCCPAREAGSFLASIAKTHAGTEKSLAFLAGGETVVKLTGTGLGGRNQELALAAAPGISGLDNAAVFSFGSDGTDGPTDAAGGIVDGETEGKLRALGIRTADVLQENNSYHALEKVGSLIVTGATGTNVNDLAVVLLKARKRSTLNE